jgi:hypothetical protein
MIQDAVRLFNLIDQQAAQYGFGVQKIEPNLDGISCRVELSSPEGKRGKTITIFRDAIEQTIRENKLAAAIAQNVDWELSEGNAGAIARSASAHPTRGRYYRSMRNDL